MGTKEIKQLLLNKLFTQLKPNTTQHNTNTNTNNIQQLQHRVVLQAKVKKATEAAKPPYMCSLSDYPQLWKNTQVKVVEHDQQVITAQVKHTLLYTQLVMFQV